VNLLNQAIEEFGQQSIRYSAMEHDKDAPSSSSSPQPAGGGGSSSIQDMLAPELAQALQRFHSATQVNVSTTPR
jgi:hypothetical protein